MAMRPYVTYTPCDTSSGEQTGDIITFTHFEEGNSPSETNSPSKTCNNAESGDKSNDDSIIPPLPREKKKGMQWIMVMSQIMTLYLHKC